MNKQVFLGCFLFSGFFFRENFKYIQKQRDYYNAVPLPSINDDQFLANLVRFVPSPPLPTSFTKTFSLKLLGNIYLDTLVLP